jgi:hypothetical protein
LAGLANAERRLTIVERRSPLESQPSLAQDVPLSLEVVIGLSEDGLSDPARRALRRLGWFPPRPGTFGEDAALGAQDLPSTLSGGRASTAHGESDSAAAVEGAHGNPPLAPGSLRLSSARLALNELVDPASLVPGRRYSLHRLLRTTPAVVRIRAQDFAGLPRSRSSVNDRRWMTSSRQPAGGIEIAESDRRTTTLAEPGAFPTLK